MKVRCCGEECACNRRSQTNKSSISCRSLEEAWRRDRKVKLLQGKPEAAASPQWQRLPPLTFLDLHCPVSLFSLFVLPQTNCSATHRPTRLLGIRTPALLVRPALYLHGTSCQEKHCVPAFHFECSCKDIKIVKIKSK